MFWVASRPGQALVWSQAGGSLRAESAGVWWSSMPYQNRIQYAPFVENQAIIEENWDPLFGDRKNELVFIGQEMDIEKIREDLNSCLATATEIDNGDWEDGYDDEWPIQRTYALND